MRRTIPSELWSHIFSFLTLKQLVGKLASTSKQSAIFLNSTLPNAAPNLLNILVTGVPEAGSTTIYTRLKHEIGLKSGLRNLSESNDQLEAPLKLVNDTSYNTDAISLHHGTHAIIWHGSTKIKQSSMMFAHSGAFQCIMYVVPCGTLTDIADTIQQNILAYYALATDPQWIFVINKMDLVHYSEDEYNKCVESIKNIAVKVIGQKRMDKFHFIPMSANDMQTRITSDINNVNMPWINKNTMNLWHVVNQISINDNGWSPLKIFKKFRATIVKIYPKKAKDRIIAVYVTEGCISVGDIIQFLPKHPSKDVVYWGNHAWENEKYPKVLEIQWFGQSKQHALPNSLVALRLGDGTYPIPKHHHVHYPMISDSRYPGHLMSNRPYLYWERRPFLLLTATLVHVGETTPKYHWKGLINQGFSGAIHTLGVRANIKVDQILKIYDKKGNALDLAQIKNERKGLAIKKGEKADVLLLSNLFLPLNTTFRHPEFKDSCGRFVIQVNYNKIVAVGVITNYYKNNTIK